jgi:hypothetical protein
MVALFKERLVGRRSTKIGNDTSNVYSTKSRSRNMARICSRKLDTNLSKTNIKDDYEEFYEIGLV